MYIYVYMYMHIYIWGSRVGLRFAHEQRAHHKRLFEGGEKGALSPRLQCAASSAPFIWLRQQDRRSQQMNIPPISIARITNGCLNKRGRGLECTIYLYVYLYIYVCMYICIFIYIYMGFSGKPPFRPQAARASQTAANQGEKGALSPSLQCAASCVLFLWVR